MVNNQIDKKITLEYIKEIVRNEKFVLIYFESRLCGVCTVIKSKLQEILTKYPNIIVSYMEVEKYKDIAAYYNFFTAPGLIVFIEGKETIREAGIINVDDIDLKLSRYNEMLQEETK